MAWLDIWKLPVKSMVIFHDAKWEKTNDWIAGHASHHSVVVPAQSHFRPAVERWVKDSEVSIVDSWFPQRVREWKEIILTLLDLRSSRFILNGSNGRIITYWLSEPARSCTRDSISTDPAWSITTFMPLEP
jgi:hypothetical protein